MQTIERIVSTVNRRVDETNPMVDARLPSGERVNVIIPPLSLTGAILTIRRFPRSYTLQELSGFGSLDEHMLYLLAGLVQARFNIIVSGATGTGKTTLLNALSGLIPEGDRIITIEDSAELQLQQRHVVRLESRPPNVEGQGQITIRDLVRNSLRMRPDRIVVGEVRGGESLDMLQAMSTGHDGSLATVHANSAEDALMRLKTLASMSEVEIPFEALHDQINSAVDVIIQLTRFADGARRITEIALLDSSGSEPYRLVSVARFQAQPMAADGRIYGRFEYFPLPRRTVDRLYMASQPTPRHSAWPSPRPSCPSEKPGRTHPHGPQGTGAAHHRDHPGDLRAGRRRRPRLRQGPGPAGRPGRPAVGRRPGVVHRPSASLPRPGPATAPYPARQAAGTPARGDGPGRDTGRVLRRDARRGGRPVAGR